MAKQKVNEGAAVTSWDSADAALAEIKRFELSISNRENEKDADLAAVKSRHDKSIQVLIEQRDALAKAVKEFATIHRVELGKMKSRKLNSGTVGFRLGMPALKPLKGWTFGKVLEMVRERGLRRYVRAKYSLDRQAILKANLDEEKQKDLGVEIVQEETFYYEFPDVETVNTKG